MIVPKGDYIFIDNGPWDDLEALLSPEIRANYNKHGYPYASAPNGMRWYYVPLQDGMGKKVAIFRGGEDAQHDYEETCSL